MKCIGDHYIFAHTEFTKDTNETLSRPEVT